MSPSISPCSLSSSNGSGARPCVYTICTHRRRTLQFHYAWLALNNANVYCILVKREGDRRASQYCFLIFQIVIEFGWVFTITLVEPTGE